MNVNFDLEVYYATNDHDCLCFTCAIKEANTGKHVTTKVVDISDHMVSSSCKKCDTYDF